jgi:Family of unknown function (DUF6169)
MDSNLRPYHLLRINPLTYSFTTDNGIEYYCSFVSYAEYFPGHPGVAPHIFAFNLELKDKKAKTKGIDKRIADTVITIAGNFLEARNNAMVYVCDNSDGREAARFRKFKSWFDYYDHPSHQITQITNSFEVGGMTIHSAMLIHHKNKRRQKFLNAYFSLVDEEEK